jgi:chromosome segregation ATPase
MAEKTPVGDMPRMVPDRDDIRRRANLQPERKPVPAAPAPKETSGNSWVMITLLIVSGVAIGYLALQQYSLTQLLNSYEERLELADDRIIALERSLTETDESVAMNGTAINAQFKAIKNETDFQMSEIRKLWDVANKRNRQWIEDNQASLKSQEGLIAGLDNSLKNLQTNLSTLQNSQQSDEQLLAELSSSLATEQAELAALSLAMDTVGEEVDAVNRSINEVLQANIDERLLTLTLTQENLQSEQGSIDSRVLTNGNDIAEINESLRAVDAYRLETSQRLSALVAQLETLNAQVTALTGSSQ